MKIGLIGGTGMEELLLGLANLGDGGGSIKRAFEHVYGEEVCYSVLSIGSNTIYFIDRHHSLGDFLLPHQLIRRKAQQRYIYLLSKILGARVVLATSAVGAIIGSANLDNPQVGEIYCPTDAIDYTGLPFTFADMLNQASVDFHRSMDDLFCHSLARLMVDVSKGGVSRKGILGSTLQGPRFETRAEIDRYRKDGVDFLSMSTCFPEAVLAREAGMSFGLLACVTNLCPEASAPLNGSQVKRAMKDQQLKLLQILLGTIDFLSTGGYLSGCDCRSFSSVL